ncbi:MAG: glycosyltransferase [Streptosporangiaceae bacterium]
MPSPPCDSARRIAAGAVAAHLLWEIATLARTRRAARTALAPPPAPPRLDADESAAVLHLLVPALAEQPYVRRTVAAFAAVRDAYPHAHVWFVTTTREQRPATDGMTTRDALERALAGTDSERMEVLHDPSPAGNKASQLNWAVHRLDRRPDLLDDRAWVGVFDFDSQPHPDTAAWVAARARRGRPEAIQVVPINVTTLTGPPANAFARAVILTEGLHHATRSLGVERWKLDRSEAGRRMPQYLVGAGMFVRRDALRTAGGFPFVDDVPLGYRMFLDRARFATVPVLNRVDLPDTIAAHLESLKLIARGVISWVPVLGASRASRTVHGWDRFRLAGLGVADTAELTTYPWLAAILTPTLLRRSWSGRILAAAWWGFPIAQTAVMRHVLADELSSDTWRVPTPALAGVSIARRFWRTIGAWRLAVDAARARLRGGAVSFSKPSRSAGTGPGGADGPM